MGQHNQVKQLESDSIRRDRSDSDVENEKYLLLRVKSGRGSNTVSDEWTIGILMNYSDTDEQYFIVNIMNVEDHIKTLKEKNAFTQTLEKKVMFPDVRNSIRRL